MKKVYVNEKWCLGCHLCEYNCAFANSGCEDMVKALKDKPIYPRIKVDDKDQIHFAVSCRHCDDPICVKSCIAGAISKKDGVVVIDKDKCVKTFETHYHKEKALISWIKAHKVKVLNSGIKVA